MKKTLVKSTALVLVFAMLLSVFAVFGASAKAADEGEKPTTPENKIVSVLGFLKHLPVSEMINETTQFIKAQADVLANFGKEWVNTEFAGKHGSTWEYKGSISEALMNKNYKLDALKAAAKALLNELKNAAGDYKSEDVVEAENELEEKVCNTFVAVKEAVKTIAEKAKTTAQVLNANKLGYVKAMFAKLSNNDSKGEYSDGWKFLNNIRWWPKWNRNPIRTNGGVK